MLAEPGAGRRLLLVDAHGLAFRAYHALPEMTNRRGEPTRVAYGYTSMLLLALSQGFDCAASAFDPPGPSFRDAKLATYKAKRPPVPEELSAQIPVCQRITEKLNIPVLMVPGYEADDVIGTLSRQAREAGWQTVILSGDMDMLQLVDEATVVQSSHRGSQEPVVYDIPAVRQRYGFDPIRVIDFKALRGDSSDNIPGIPGIGDKGATQLIQQYGSLDGILEAVEEMPPGRIRKALEGNSELANFGRELVTIVRDVPEVSLDLSGCALREYDREGAAALLEELGMPSLVARLPSSEGAAQATQDERPQLAPTRLVDSVAELDALCGQLRSAGRFSVAVATWGPSRKGEVVGLGLATQVDQSWYVPVTRDGAEGLAWEQLRPLLDVLQDPSIDKSGYQLKDSLLALRGAGSDLAGGDFDCVLAGYLADSRTRTPTLAALCREWSGPTLPDPESYLGRGVRARGPETLEKSQAAELLGSEAAAVAAIRPPLERRLRELGGAELLRDLELPVLQILADMEAVGVRLDSEQLGFISVELEQQTRHLEEEMFRLAGRTFQPGSPSQLAALLYDELGLKSSRRTKTGRSTDAQALESLREEHPIVALVLEWRQVTKLKSTYVDALPQLVDPDDGRVHTSFNQAVAATGRLSSSDPNLQNIPIRSELGRRIRAAFVPGSPDWVLVSADYSQIELRVLAHLSQDPQLLAAFEKGQDIHTETAAQVFEVDPQEVSRDQRRMAKVVNFGILYGLSSFGLGRDLGIASDVANEFIQRYFGTYRGVRDYLQSVREEARSKGYVATILGRRRYLTDINASNRQVREASERMAINMPIQGSAADVMKLGMIRAAQALGAAGSPAHMLLQVHDELVFEVPREKAQETGAMAAQAMRDAISLRVPLAVEVRTGPNWRDLTPLQLAGA